MSLLTVYDITFYGKAQGHEIVCYSRAPQTNNEHPNNLQHANAQNNNRKHPNVMTTTTALNIESTDFHLAHASDIREVKNCSVRPLPL